MKYINQIINSNIDVEGIVSNRKILKPFTIFIAIIVSVTGVVILSGALPLAGVIDSGRYIKLQYYHYTKIQRRKKYIETVLISLSASKGEIKRFKTQLKKFVTH